MTSRPITHVATTDISDMMNPGTERRMPLPGFDDEFVDFPHYIIRITDRIWHDREVELCLKWYSEDCAIHTLGGDIVGAQTVVDNTWATLAAFPDRRLDADNVIWSREEDGAFYSSHLITSKMTNLGASEFGPATGSRVRVQTIADCLCRDNRIVEEWLVRDNLALVRQLGFNPDEIARKRASAARDRGQDLVAFHAGNRARVLSGDSIRPAPGSGAAIAAGMLQSVWSEKRAGAAADFYDFRVGGSYPGGESLYGPDEVTAWLAPMLSSFPDAQLCVDHVAEIPYLGEARDVALRWSLAGTHTGQGRYGDPTGAPVYILGVSHFRIMNGRIREETVVFDDLALRQQIEGWRLSQSG
jgi:predicted ester cyclase